MINLFCKSAKSTVDKVFIFAEIIKNTQLCTNLFYKVSERANNTGFRKKV